MTPTPIGVFYSKEYIFYGVTDDECRFCVSPYFWVPLATLDHKDTGGHTHWSHTGHTERRWSRTTHRIVIYPDPNAPRVKCIPECDMTTRQQKITWGCIPAQRQIYT